MVSRLITPPVEDGKPVNHTAAVTVVAVWLLLAGLVIVYPDNTSPSATNSPISDLSISYL